jgi:hypothetical protein
MNYEELTTRIDDQKVEDCLAGSTGQTSTATIPSAAKAGFPSTLSAGLKPGPPKPEAHEACGASAAFILKSASETMSGPDDDPDPTFPPEAA